MTATTTSTDVSFALTERAPRTSSEEIARKLENPGFGQIFTDHMVLIDWEVGKGWHDARVVPYGTIPLDPSAAVFHYEIGRASCRERV